MRTLERDPANRYQTAGMLGDDLAAVATELGADRSPTVLAHLCRGLFRT